MMSFSTTTCIAGLIAAIFSAESRGFCPQDSDSSFAGPPPAVDENAVPFGIGFNQKGGELSATALEQAALGNPTIHYHYYPTASTNKAAQVPQDNATTSTGQDSVAPQDGQPIGVPSTAPGYARDTFVAPLENQTHTSWHLYAGRTGSSLQQGLVTNTGGNLGGNMHYYLPSLAPGALGAASDRAFDTGGNIGDWDPYAGGGAGTIAGFDWGQANGFD